MLFKPRISLYRARVSISVGVFSKMIAMQSLKIGIVVIKTRIVKRNVQIGSAIENFAGLMTIMIPAVMTPTL